LKRFASFVIVFPLFFNFTNISTSSYLEPRMIPLNQPQASPNTSVLEGMLTDSHLWGEDGFALFASLDRWSNAGETSVLIYPDRVIGGTRFETLEDARQRASQIAAAIQRPGAKLRPQFAAHYRLALAKRPLPLEIEAARFLEDDSFRVIWQRKDAHYLQKDLTMHAILNSYGSPQKTTTEVVQSRGERRPAVLTIHHYANGAINFVESDCSPNPGLVDRAVVDAGPVVSQIFVRKQ
jgi:hypothetical protein